MKRLLAKALTSTTVLLVTFTTAQANNHYQSPIPTASEEIPGAHSYSPELLQYWEKREATIAKEAMEAKEALKGRRPPLRPAYLPWAAPLFTPAQLQYGDKREAEIKDELMKRQRSGGTTSQESAMEWMQRQPNIP